MTFNILVYVNLVLILLLGVVIYSFKYVFVKKKITSDQKITDPWELQRMLMGASGQELPSKPEINKTSLLYWALMLEEMSETGYGVLTVLLREWTMNNPIVDDLSDSRRVIQLMVESQCSQMHHGSIRLRKTLEDLPEFHTLMLRDEAKEVLDGTTDNAVVNAGFCLASGMPGSEAYAETVNSNLSKRNDDGVIDKTPDGKWIKSHNYKAPDLDKVLNSFMHVL